MWGRPHAVVARKILSKDPAQIMINFSEKRCNEKWVSDISYIPTAEGFLYLGIIIDLFSRAVVGIQMGSSQTHHLILEAFEQAIEHRNNPKDFIFHSDRGVQYACDHFRSILKEKSIAQSMSRKGNCWDNSVAESFFGTLKLELLSDKYFATKTEARAAIFEYIEVFYNRKRKHSYLGYLPPIEFEARFHSGRLTGN